MSEPPRHLPESLRDAGFREMRQRTRAMFAHALRECSIPKAFARHIGYDRGYLRMGNETYDLGSFAQVRVISIGKAAQAMAEALAGVVGAGLTGVVAAPTSPSAQLFGFRYFLGGHPLPNEDSLRAGNAILKLANTSSPETLFLYCISGGASAIAEKPVRDDITLQDLVETYRVLVHSGATIAEINAIRKHLSAIKGGRLAQAVSPCFQTSILVSDVPEDSLDALASGPTMPDSTTVADCYAIAERYRMTKHFPTGVRVLFERRQLNETPKAGDRAFERSGYLTILSNAAAEKAVVERAVLDGFAVEVDNSCDDWDYRKAADHLLRRLRELRRGVSRACLISGGEVTVKLSDKSGEGGRNQQFALYCAEKIAGENITVLSAGTDGIDGNSIAAGGVVDGTSVERARAQGLDTATALADFDAYPLLEALGDSIITGPTGNNVRDLRILLAH